MYAWEGGPALVQTVDFFTPIVDDPYVYGQIAAANAAERRLRDGRAAAHGAGDRGFPEDRARQPSDIAAIFKGGFDKLREAGVALLGGHTVQDEEIKFGYAVTGAVDPARMLTNARREAGRRADPDQAARHRGDRHGDQVRSRAGAAWSRPPSRRCAR